MNDSDKQKPDRLEHLLRRWGAEEATDGLSVPPAPTPARGRGTWVIQLRRWAPLVAASILLLVSIAVKLTPSHQRHDELAQSIAVKDDQLKQAQDLLAERETTIAGLRDQLARSQSELDQVSGKLLSQIDQRDQELAEINDRLAGTEQQLQDLRAAATEEKSSLQAQLAEAQADRQQLQQQLDETQTEIGELTDALASLQRTASAAGRGDPASVQQAARQANLLQRCQRLRKTLRSEDTAELLDTAEVLLTRLDLLNTADRAELTALAGIIESVNFAEQVAQVISHGREDSRVAAYLTEVQLVLTEVQNAV